MKYLLINYWNIYKIGIGKHEDVRILSHFVNKGVFLEHQKSSNFYLRFHPYNDSHIKDERPRLKLISWLKTLNINVFFKLILVFSSKLQYLIYYKRFESKRILNMRNKLIKKREGGKVKNSYSSQLKI